MTTGTMKSAAAKTTIASTLYTTLITTASMTSTTGPALSRSTFIDADIDVVIVTSATISLLYYFTIYRKKIFTFCRNLTRRTWSSGSDYSQYNTQEGCEPGTSDPSSWTEKELFSDDTPLTTDLCMKRFAMFANSDKRNYKRDKTNILFRYTAT